MGQVARALKLYPRAVRLFRRALELWPEHAESRERFCQVLSAYGSTLCYSGRIDEGQPLLEEALAAAEQLAEDYPSNFGFGRVRGTCLAALATCHALRGQAASARELFEEAIVELDVAVEALSDWSVLRDAASTYNNAASFELNFGDAEAAGPLARRAFESLGMLRRRSPGRVALEPLVQTISLTYAEAQLQLGQPDEALTAVAELDGHAETANLAFARGELKARSAHLYKSAAAAPGAGRQDALGRSEALRDEACEHFRRALELGYSDYDYLRSGPDLDSIRDHPEFAALLEGLEGR
jgi:tetratricopeptide (TPR) repeat protein